MWTVNIGIALSVSLIFLLQYQIALGQDIGQPSVIIVIIPGASNPDILNPFLPISLNVALGTTVSWTNNDNVLHTVTSFSGEFDSGAMEPKKSFFHTFYVPGYYNYYCKIHPYMNGEIMVR